MRKIILSLAVIFALSACSLDDMFSLLITPTPVPPTAVDTITPTIMQTPSRTGTITPIPSFTTTPTLSREGEENEDDVYNNVLPTLYLVPTATSGPQTYLFSEPGSLITSVTTSSDILFWGYCNAPKYVDFNVRLANNLHVGYVLLFMRLVDKGGNQSTAWGGGAIMEMETGSLYTYRVRPENLSHYEEFKDAWIEFQVVVTSRSLKRLGSSPVSLQDLSLRKCQVSEVDE